MFKTLADIVKHAYNEVLGTGDFASLGCSNIILCLMSLQNTKPTREGDKIKTNKMIFTIYINSNTASIQATCT